MAMTEARKRANKKWNDENMSKRYEQLNVLLPAGRRALIRARAEEKGMSASAYISSLVCADLGITESEWKE